MYNELQKKLENSDWQEIVRQLISLYGSTSEGYAESCLSVACSALETITWIRLVEEQEWLSSDGFEKLTAGAKLRLLLVLCSISIELPKQLEELTRQAKKPDMANMKGPEVIQWVRNRVVHPDRKNQLTAELKIEARTGAIWYLELALLHFFNYKGKYENRITYECESVPWAK